MSGALRAPPRLLALAVALLLASGASALPGRTPPRGPSKQQRGGWRSPFSPPPPPPAKRGGPKLRLAPARRSQPEPSLRGPSFSLPPLPTPPSAAEIRARLAAAPAEIRQAALHAPGKLRSGLADAIAVFNPGVFAAGFASAIIAVAATTTVIANEATAFLSEGGRGEVLERALLFGAILGDVKEAYVDGQAVDLDELFDTGVNAMLATLDPYTTYEDASHAEDLSTRTSGRYGGIGITIGADESDPTGSPSVLVLSALEGYAYDAGVRPGDRIVRVDGLPIGGKPVDEVKTMLRGTPGTEVALSLQRDGAAQGQAVELLVQRREVRLPDVSLSTLLAPGTGYVKLDGFSEGTAEELAVALLRLFETERVTGERVESLVLDLRDNPGGLLDAAVGVAQLLVPKGTDIVSTEGRVYGEGATLNYRSIHPPLVPASTRLVVLVNGNTASAAEIVTGVVQDTDRGVVVGEKTFGKGLVQVVEPLPGGRSLKLTVAKYFTPSGRCIQAISYAKPQKALTKATQPSGSSAPTADPADPPGATPGVPITNQGGRQSAPAGLRPPQDAGLPSPPALAAAGPDDTGGGGDAEARRRADAFLRSRETFTERSMRAGEVFTTANGREVKTGGGIAPDVQVSAKPVGVLERSLLRQGAFFRFAGLWLAEHEGTPREQAAVLSSPRGTEEAYREFVAFARERYLTKGSAARAPLPAASPADSPSPDSSPRPAAAPGDSADVLEEDDSTLWLVQDRTLAEPLRQLEKALGATGERPRSASGLRALRKTLAAEELAQFDTQRAVLAKDVRDSVLARLLPPSQRLRDFIRDDPQVQEAVAVANDPSRYASLLAPPPAAIFPPAGLPQTIASVRPAATVSRSLPTPFSVAPVLAPPRAAAPPTPPAGIPSAEISWGNTDAGPSPPVASRLAAPDGPGVRGAGLSTSSVRRA